MQNTICRKLAFFATVAPLPALALCMVLGTLRAGLAWEFLRYPTTTLLIAAGVSYLLSLILSVVCGFLFKAASLLVPPISSLLLIALFVALLPDDVREDPWRVIDVIIFVGLIALNILQILLLRRRSLAETNRNMG
jgi:hypothetical protein